MFHINPPSFITKELILTLLQQNLTENKYMKFSTLSLKISFLFFFLILLTPEIKSQSDFSIGARIGSGYISGNSPDETSLNSCVFLQMKTVFSDIFFARLSFFYNRDIDYFLRTRKDYYPFIKGVTLKGITSQGMANNMFLEEGIGLLYINDRTFSDVNSDDYGVVFSLTGGYDFRNSLPTGFKFGLGVEYGITFNKTLANYLSIYVQGQYYF
jgi:hypothetical protein